MKKVLVAYFSASGVTENLAKNLAQVVNGDLFEMKPVTAYTAADLDWNDANSRSSLEMKDPNSRPAIAQQVSNMAQYDTVFVGFPIWWYVCPRIVQTFLESYDFSGKTVIGFATSGSSGMGKTDDVLKQCCSGETNWKPGKRLNANSDTKTIQEWVDSLHLS